MRMAKKSSKPKMGRPLLPPGKRRRPSMGFRPTPTMRSKLEEAAGANGRAMSQEIEARLEQSFIGDGVIHHMFGFDLGSMMALRALADAIAKIERGAGKSWREDWTAREQVRAAFEAILEVFGPQHPAENRLTPQGRARVEKRALRNQIDGRMAALSSVKALVPGVKVAFDMLEKD